MSRWGRRAANFARGPARLVLRPPDPDAVRRRVLALGDGLRISVVVPVYETDAALLKACVASVKAQAYGRWELILVDDGSKAAHLPSLLAAMARSDRRISVIRRPTNGGISAATNDGCDAATGAFTLFLDHDDLITPDALLELAEAVTARPDLDAVYSDQVKIDSRGHIIEHHFKPDWSPIFLLGVMYVGHFLAVRSDLARRLRFLPRFDGVQDFEFMLRLAEATTRIHHVDRALYAWRAVPGSVALDAGEKRGIDELQQDAVAQHLQRLGRTWSTQPHPVLRHRLRLSASPATARPSVSVIIPSRDQPDIVGRCLATLREVTDYLDMEIVVVDNGTTDPVARGHIDRFADLRVPLDESFSFSLANNRGAAAARGEVLVFLNNDTEVTDPAWLADLVAFLEDPMIGAVGPTLLYPSGLVQHAGVVLGARGTADHVMRHFDPAWDGYAGSLVAAREVSAVTAACLLLRRSLFETVGGFSCDYRKHYQDVDLCLRLRERGYSIICAAGTRLVHHESVTRKEHGYDLGDRAILIDRWHEAIAAGDRFYNRNLVLESLKYDPLPETFVKIRSWFPA